ncbi:MAG TPA: glycosyltransferase family 39 protein [Streptosporangiaceae bacterium]
MAHLSEGTEAAPVSAAVPGGVAPVSRWVFAAGGVVFAVLMVLSSRYGFQRDELYFLDCARHLQASYVDQPVLGPLLARLSLDLFGVSLPGLRLWPALASGATVIIGGLTAREFGGGRRAQLLAAVGAATMPALLGSGHVANTTSYDILAWAGLGLVVARIGRTGETRWWLAAGVVAGLGAEDNHLAGIFAAALLAGALLSGARRMVANRWFAAGAVIAVALLVPDLWWQAQHGWATIAMTHALNQENGGAAHIATWVFGQLGMAAPPMVWVWAVGLRFLWRSGRPLWRALAWAYGILFVLFAVTTGGQVYYLAGAYVYLLAAGAVSLDGWLHERPARLHRLLVVTGLVTAVFAVIVLPVLPPADDGWTYKISTTPGETIGWPQLVRSVRTVWTALPPAQRAHAVIFTADYSEAGAINELGRGMGLPVAVGGQNSDWWWGPGDPAASTVVAVAPGPGAAPGYAAYLGRFFTSVRTVATLSNPDGMHNIEWHGHVYLCTGPREPWGQMWPRLRHYD